MKNSNKHIDPYKKYGEIPLPHEKELYALFDRNAHLTIFEIGACEGLDTVKYSRLFNHARMYAFEPLPKNYKMLQDTIEKNKLSNVAIYCLAMSKKSGISKFYVSSDNPSNSKSNENWDAGNKSSSLLPPDKHIEKYPFIRFSEIIDVETITIEEFCIKNNISIIDYLHMDVQGAELFVLEGAGQYINHIKVVWLEVSRLSLYKNQPLANDINLFFKHNNFVKYKEFKSGIQSDCMYINKRFYNIPLFFKKFLKVRPLT